MNVWLMIGIAYVTSILVMIGVWFLQKRLGDAGIVDVVWSYGVGLNALFFAVFSTGGNGVRRTIVATLAMIWAIRLGTHVLYRVIKFDEDGRYVALKEKSGSAAQSKLFWFYQAQAFACTLFALPMLLASQSAADIGLLDYLGVAIWIVAISGEAIADAQLNRFRKNRDNKGKVCQTGLWKFSRHPNYFFEWVHWWSYVSFALISTWGWLTILGPISMLYFILTKTGIPPTEEQALKSRGDAYRRYQQTTSAFFPMPPKKFQPVEGLAAEPSSNAP